MKQSTQQPSQSEMSVNEDISLINGAKKPEEKDSACATCCYTLFALPKWYTDALAEGRHPKLSPGM